MKIFFYIIGKPVLGHLCIKYLKMIILTKYALKPVMRIFKKKSNYAALVNSLTYLN